MSGLHCILVLFYLLSKCWHFETHKNKLLQNVKHTLNSKFIIVFVFCVEGPTFKKIEGVAEESKIISKIIAPTST